MSQNYLQIIDILKMWWERKGSEITDDFFFICTQYNATVQGNSKESRTVYRGPEKH